MKRQEFYDAIDETYRSAFAILKSKNDDYASDEDPFKNFRNSSIVGIPPELGILVRMVDKVTRCGNLIRNRSASVKDESIGDTLIDIANYAVIIKVYLEGKA